VLKNATYECGVSPPPATLAIQFKAHYDLYAILFLVFDVEVLFLLLVAVAFTELSAGAPRDAGLYPAARRGPRLGPAPRSPRWK